MKKKLILSLILYWISGSAPWCAVDNFGDLQCTYYSYQDCSDMLKREPYGAWVSCMRHPDDK